MEKQLCQPSVTDLKLTTARVLKVRARREQVPLTIVMASTLYILQGTTAEPGLIYYFRTPGRLEKVMKWIACYMALSRVRGLSELRSIGLTDRIQEFSHLGAGSIVEFRLPILSQRIGSSNATFVCRLQVAPHGFRPQITRYYPRYPRTCSH